MSVKPILEEMLALIRSQVAAVIAGDAQAVQSGADRHEQLLAALQSAQVTEHPEELQAIMAEIDREKTKLMSLLTSEAARADFLLRLILGPSAAKPSAYPGGTGRPETGARMINRRT